MGATAAGQSGFGMEDIIARSSEIAIIIFDDSYKTDIIILVDLTMNFGFYTLGCKVNQYETQAMEQILRQMGHGIVPFEAVCDGYIINNDILSNSS